MKTVIAIVLIAAGIYYGAQRGWIGGAWLGRVLGLGPSEDQASVEQTIRNTNAKLPAMLDEHISFDRVVAGKKDVVFHYRFVNHDDAHAPYAFNLQKTRYAIIDDVCARKDIRDYAFDKGYNLQVLVFSSNHKRLIEAYLSPTACPR
jgi:hypothetical protein